MNNDLSILVKTILQPTSVTNLKTEVENLVKNLSKLNIEIKIDDKIISTINNISKVMESMNIATQQANKSSTQNIQIVKELDGTVKKYSETIKANGEIIKKTTEILDKNKIAKQQSASSQIVNNINKETEAIKKLDSEYNKLIKTVKIKKANGDPLRTDETYLNSKTGVKTTITSRPGQDNVYRTDVSKNNELLKEQMKLARESAKLAKESNDYQQKYYIIQSKAQKDLDNAFLESAKNKRKEAEKLAQQQAKISNKDQLDAYNLKLKQQQEIEYALLETQRKRREEVEKLAQTQGKAINKAKEDAYKSQQQAKLDAEKLVQSQLNKINPKVISSDKMTDQVKLLPSGTKKVDDAKKKVDAFVKYLDSLDLRIKKGELITPETFRILDRYESEVKRVIKNTQDILKLNGSSSTKAVKLFDFNTATSELNKFKSEVDKIKSSLSVGGNIVNKSSIDEFGRLNLEIRNQAGFIEKIKYQWDTVAQSLHKVNIEQNQNNDALKAFKISNVKDLADLGRKYKGVVDKEDIKNIVDYIRNIQVLDQTTKSMVKGKIENLQFKVSNADSINKEIDKISKQLNTKMQNALNLGIKFGNLSPEQLAPLEKALNRYKTLINDMKQKNISGQVVSDKDLERLSRLENAIKRVYDLTRIASKDSRGFNFEQYPKMTNAIQNATNAQEYFNKSMLQGKKLLESSVQQTEKYIKVTQRLRQGSEISNITAYINKATGETHRFSESMKSLMTRTYDLGSAFKTAMEKFSIWMASGTIIFQSWHFLKDGISYVNQYNKALTELSVVYMQTQNQVEKLGEKLHNLSIEMGVSTQEVAKGAVEFARQGLSEVESIKRMETAMKYAKISNLDFSTSARILTATVNSMGVSAERAADVFSYMGDATATGW